MPRSSRHKSHRLSKHSSKDAREHSDSEEDMKMKDLKGKDEDSARVSRNVGSSEKRKDPPGHSNGDISEDYVALKRRREKADVSAAVSDRWNGGDSTAVVDNEIKGETLRTGSEKTLKSRTSVDLKSKSSRMQDSGCEKKVESKSTIKVESKRKYEKESSRKEVQQSKDSKDKDRVLEKERDWERKAKDSERDIEVEVVDIGEPEAKPVWPLQDEPRIPDLEKELEKRRRKKDGSDEKDKYQDDVKVSGDRRLPLRGERAKDGKYKDEKHKDGSHGEKYRGTDDRDAKYKDEKCFEDADKERRYRDAKYRESGEQDSRHKDDKYREDVDRDKRLRDDKYREGRDRDNKHKDVKYREDVDKDYRRRAGKYHEDGDRDDRHKDDRYFEGSSRDVRNREERNWEDAGRDIRHREGKQRDDSVKDKRLRDIKYQDERFLRDGTNDKSDPKRYRDDSETAEFRQKKSTNRDGSPKFDDRSTKYKDDRVKRRTNDKEDHEDIRLRSIKEQQVDIDKKFGSSARVESVGNRGRSSLRDADVVISPNHVKRGNSPSYRLSKQEESRYQDYMHGGRERRDVTPGMEYAGVSVVTEKLPRSIEKSLEKDDGHVDDASTERRPKEDALASNFQMVDKSPSSTSNDRRHLKRPDVRRSLDVEESGQRSGGSKELRDYYARDGRGIRELPLENLHGDELSQVDGDNISVSSPFNKPAHLGNNSRSFLPPTPFRMGLDRPFEDENRGKPNRRRRMDPNMGRLQGNAWRGVPNWPSPVANGFVPFQHGPPPIGFHPVMQQFSAPPMFGVRPSLELNQSGVPYHVHDGDRYSGHGRPLGWDGNNSIFGDESHIYGRLDWDHNRSLNSGRGWESSRDMWKGQSSGMGTELPALPQKDDFSAHGTGDEDWPGKSGPPALTEKKQPGVQAESNIIDPSTEVVEGSTPAAAGAIPEEISPLKTKDDDAYLYRAYLSVLDISEDLCQVELYAQYTDLMAMTQTANPKEDNPKILIMEDDTYSSGENSNKIPNASLSLNMNDSIFQRAMSLYKKVKEEATNTRQGNVPSLRGENFEPALLSDPVEAALNGEQSVEMIPALEPKETENLVSDLSNVKIEAGSVQVAAHAGEKSDETIATTNKVKREMAPVVKEEKTDDLVQDRPSFPKEVNESYSSDSKGNEGCKLADDGKFVPLPFTAEVGTEGVVESGSVNLSRIHPSPESTH